MSYILKGGKKCYEYSYHSTHNIIGYDSMGNTGEDSTLEGFPSDPDEWQWIEPKPTKW